MPCGVRDGDAQLCVGDTLLSLDTTISYGFAEISIVDKFFMQGTLICSVKNVLLQFKNEQRWLIYDQMKHIGKSISR